MDLNFKNEKYKEKAIEIAKKSSVNIKKTLENEDAFLVLIHGISKDDLSNLCEKISKYYNISIEQAYEITQNNKIKEIELLPLAYEILSQGKHLGNTINPNTTLNTSSWISHSLYTALLSSELAEMIGIDSNFAFNYGLLHDYGRKYTHNFNHVIRGFEELINLGLEEEAKGCLTHSFINGGRYCDNETVAEGFYIDELGKERFLTNKKPDDISDVLSKSNYTEYDNILNITDLMATSKGIVAPKMRIDDIATRRKNIDASLNRKYFLASFSNLLLDTLKKIETNIPLSNINEKALNLEEIKKHFELVSDVFFYIYQDEKRDTLKKKKILN